MTNYIFKVTNDCNIDYGCFKYPFDCQNDLCDYVAKWKRIDEKIEFILSSKASSNNIWLGIGFSKDKLMVSILLVFMI